MSNLLLKNIPNALSVLRLILIVPFLILLYFKQYSWAFYIYVLAGITDGLDGWLARYFNWMSPLGSFIDPLADKLLVTSSFISLALMGALPWWLVILVFMRDFTISLGVMAWYWFIQQKLDFKPSMMSKANTTLQLLLVTSCLFQLAFIELPYLYLQLLILVTAFTTALTYFYYAWIWGKKAWLINAYSKSKPKSK